MFLGMRAIKAWMKPMSSMFSSLAGKVASLWQSFQLHHR
jgi:hypothetical protein